MATIKIPDYRKIQANYQKIINKEFQSEFKEFFENVKKHFVETRPDLKFKLGNLKDYRENTRDAEFLIFQKGKDGQVLLRVRASAQNGINKVETYICSSNGHLDYPKNYKDVKDFLRAVKMLPKREIIKTAQ